MILLHIPAISRLHIPAVSRLHIPAVSRLHILAVLPLDVLSGLLPERIYRFNVPATKCQARNHHTRCQDPHYPRVKHEKRFGDDQQLVKTLENSAYEIEFVCPLPRLRTHNVFSAPRVRLHGMGIAGPALVIDKGVVVRSVRYQV